MPIQNKAILISVTVHGTSGQKVDRQATRAGSEAMGAKDHAGVYSKKMFGDSVRVWGTFKSRVDAWLKRISLPWADKGLRIMEAARILETRADIAALQAEAARIKKDMGDRYDEIKAEAAATLAGMYREREYPSKEEFLAKFSFEIRYLPIPTEKDFRVALSAEEENLLRVSVQESHEKAKQKGVESIWKDLFSRVETLADKLQSENSKIKDTFLAGTLDLCQSLRALNMWDDPNFSAMTQKIEQRLTGLSEASLAQDSFQKAALASDVDRIMADMSGFMGCPIAPRGWDHADTSVEDSPPPPPSQPAQARDMSTYKCSIGPNGVSYSFG